MFIVIIIGGYLTLFLLNPHYPQHHNSFGCIFKWISGIPCPGCGMGRASLELLMGHPGRSFYFNILCMPFTVMVVAALLSMLYDTIYHKDSFARALAYKWPKYLKMIALALILGTWVLNIFHNI